MNYRMIAYVLGNMMKYEALMMVLSLIVAIIYKEYSVLWAFLLPMAILLIIGLGLSYKMPKDRSFHAREGFVTVALSWIVVSAFGALPFWLDGSIPSYVSSFFETVSGFTTTGATILTDVEALPLSLLFWRAFTHWVGGMGILVFVLTILPRSGGSSIYLMKAEMPGTTVEKLVSKVRPTVRILYGIYLGLTIIMIVLLVLAGMPLFDSIINTMSTAGTGGFSLYNTSIAHYDSALIDGIITVFMLVFSINFNLYFLIIIGKARSAIKSEDLRWFLIIVAAAMLLITLDIRGLYDGDFLTSFRYAAFTVSSVISTTGFATADFNLWPSFSKTLILLLMFIGACAGSTGGGIKVSRWIILFKSAISELKKMARPRQVTTLKFEGKPLAAQTEKSVYTYLVIYAFIVVVAVVLLSLEPFDFLTDFSAVATCINNVGPGLNLVGPVENFSIYSPFSQIVLSFCMLAGRLEVFQLLMLFTPFTWKK